MPLSPERSPAGNLLCEENPAELAFNQPPPTLLPPESDVIARFIDAETDHMPKSDYLRRCRDRDVDITARLDAINWILKVHAFYKFRPVTAFLSVNYLDRFLSCSSLPRPNGWPFQLLSVACLSLAAKMEEPQVPLLLDLQLFEPKFVFEPKTIQRMELWVMTKLNWRLRSVTPFDYLDYFISKFPSSSSSESIKSFFSIASEFILDTTRVIDFLGFAPSTVAAAAVLCSVGRGRDQSPLSFHDRINKEMVRCCHQLMEEYMVDTCPASRLKGAGAEPLPPPSPIGVLDAATCVSCDTRSERNCPGSTGDQAEPTNKRLRSSAPDDPPR